MVRTAKDGRKAVGAKAPRKQAGGGGSSSAGPSFGSPTSSGAGKNKHAGGNPVRWWPSPKWQKGIGDFFAKDESSTGNEISPEKPGPSVSSEQPGMSSEELEIEGIKPIEED
ncbi:hypothetical protein OS493_024864 [Desmophyllum pertusum]|uniref:PCNA-associated factor n=1 Tax=Desmophyllum pertusum TaxID=174260 RepID=A0A9W9YZD1_9CNID|nr:hypothetical protein OS493_024864 [Desmophyllum pertusum]